MTIGSRGRFVNEYLPRQTTRAPVDRRQIEGRDDENLCARGTRVGVSTTRAISPAPRPGHIAGAVSVPFDTLNEDRSMTLKDEATLRKLFESAGVRPGSEVVTYCHIGQQASQVYLAARLLGYRVHLYDGSYEEWAANPNLTVERAAPK